MKKFLSIAMLFSASLSFGQIFNGTFFQVSPQGFTTNYTLDCAASDPNDYCVKATGWGGIADHTVPSDHLMQVDGRPNSAAPNMVWSQNVVGLTTNTNYEFSYWIRLRNTPGNQVQLRAFANGAAQGTTFTTTDMTQWLNVITIINTGASTSLNLEIRQMNWGAASDFNLDDIRLTTDAQGECAVSSNFSFTATGNPCEYQLTPHSFVNTTNTQILGYSWDLGGGVGSTATSPIVQFTGAGTYNVCLTTYGVDDDGNCCSDTRCIDIVASCYDEGCDVNASFEYSGEECSYSFYGYGSTSGTIIGYVWDFGDGTTANGASPTHTYTSSGNYLVCLTVIAIGADGECCTDTKCIEIEVECEGRGGEEKRGNTSKTDENASAMLLYPNPVNGSLTMEWNNADHAASGSIYVLDNTGRIVNDMTSGVSIAEGNNLFTLDASNLPSGIYMINLVADGKMTSKKFVKE